METVEHADSANPDKSLKSSCEEWKHGTKTADDYMAFGLKSSCEEWKPGYKTSFYDLGACVLNLPVRNGNGMAEGLRRVGERS